MNDQLQNINRPQLRFSEFTEKQPFIKFGKVVESNLYGPRFNAKDYHPEGNVKTIRGTDVSNNGELRYEQVPLAKLDQNTVDNHKLKDGDLVMITTADCGLTGVFREQEIDYISSAYGVRIRLNEKGYPFYFKYFFQTRHAKKEVSSFVRKATVANLPGSDILRVRLNLPTLTEQTKIATFLTAVDKRINLLQKKKAELEDYKKGVMQKLFSVKTDNNPSLRFKNEDGSDTSTSLSTGFEDWEVKKLGEVTTLITKGTTPTSLGYKFEKIGVNFIKAENISDKFYIDIDSTSKISLECDETLKRSKLKDMDILFSIAGTLGRTAIVRKKDLPANTNQALAIIRLLENENTFFINYVLNSYKIRKRISQLLSVGAQPNLSLQQVNNFIISYPSKEEQQKIANFLSSIDKSITNCELRIMNTKEWKKGLLQQMFV